MKTHYHITAICDSPLSSTSYIAFLTNLISKYHFYNEFVNFVHNKSFFYIYIIKFLRWGLVHFVFARAPESLYSSIPILGYGYINFSDFVFFWVGVVCLCFACQLIGQPVMTMMTIPLPHYHIYFVFLYFFFGGGGGGGWSRTNCVGVKFTSTQMWYTHPRPLTYEMDPKLVKQ